MVEQVIAFDYTKDIVINKILFDENIHYIHMVFPQNEGLPIHNANATVYMTVVHGTLSIGLNEQNTHEYSAGTLLKIPFGTQMNVKNLHEKKLELIVVKAPAPANN